MSKFSFYFEKGDFVFEATKRVSKTHDGTLVFRNKMNSVLFPVNFTARDYDIFFTICWYVKQLNYTDSRDYIEMPYFELIRFFDRDINKTRFNDEVKSFRKKVLGQRGTVIYRSFEIENNDEVLTSGIFFIEMKRLEINKFYALK